MFSETYVDILGVVRGLGPIRSVTTKNNENLQVRTVEVFDHTAPSLKIEIWEPDIILRYNLPFSEVNIRDNPLFSDLTIGSLVLQQYSSLTYAFVGRVSKDRM